jgi:TetR/AcrR family hemagglutinin/protease transcriptional regulator
MTASSPARRLPPEARRAQLLACAMRVFARRGLGEARHGEIAEEAGVSTSTAFVYFPTRAALVDAVLDEVARFLIDMAERVHGRPAPAARNLLDHARAFAESVETHPDHARVWLDWSTAIREDVWPRYLAFQDRVLAILARTIRRGQREGDLPAHVEPEDVARLVVGSAHMVAQMKFSRRPPQEVERFLRALVAAALGGLDPAADAREPAPRRGGRS